METVMASELIIKLLEATDIDAMVDAFDTSQWTKKPGSLFEEYLTEQKDQKRIIWLAYHHKVFAGYVTLKWKSEYPPFAENNIPEIKDLNILPQHRNQGIGSTLLNRAEKSAFERSNIIGIGVGLYPDYGAAQRLYVKRGYIPDGKGITYNHHTAVPGNNVMLDDELILWMTKKDKYEE